MERFGDWIQTYTNKKFWPLDPRPDEVCIEDIAHALALTNRWGGHTKWPYSVAQHSILCAENVDDEFRLEALLHDASEAYMCDMPTPVKRFLPEYNSYEKNLFKYAIAPRFGLPDTKSPQVKEIDIRLMLREAKYLMNDPEWIHNYTEKPLDLEIEMWNWDTAEQMFLLSFHMYGGYDRL